MDQKSLDLPPVENQRPLERMRYLPLPAIVKVGNQTKRWPITQAEQRKAQQRQIKSAHRD